MPPPQVAKILARVMGVVMILIGLAAFVPNPLVGSEGYFRTDIVFNAVFALFGLMLLMSTRRGEGTAANGLYWVGMLAFGAAVVIHVQLSDTPSGGAAKIFDLALCNEEVAWLMAGTAVVLTLCGMMNTSSRQVVRD